MQSTDLVDDRHAGGTDGLAASERLWLERGERLGVLLRDLLGSAAAPASEPVGGDTLVGAS